MNGRLKMYCNSTGFLFTDNSNVDENRLFSGSLINALKAFDLQIYIKMVLIDTKDLTTANANISQILKELRLSNPKNVLLLCLNVNSVSLTICEKS